MDIETRFRKVVQNHLGVEESKVTEHASFIDDLGADSLDVVEITMATEEEFGVEISDDEASRMDTFGKGVELLHKKL